MSKVVDTVRELILGTVQDMQYEIIDIEYARKYENMNLTIYIYSPNGVSLDDCEKVHMAIDPILEALDFTNGDPYVLNISSPGLDRPFNTTRDFERNIGLDVEIKLYAPINKSKLFEGKLLCVSDTSITIEYKKQPMDIQRDKIALARPLIKF